MGVVPHRDDFVRAEREDAVSELDPDRSVFDLRVVQVHLQRFVELGHREHQFAFRFELRSEVVGFDYHCIPNFIFDIRNSSFYSRNSVLRRRL